MGRRVRHSRAPSGWPRSFVCLLLIPVRAIPVRVRSVQSRATCGSLVCVRSVPVRYGDRSVRSRSPLGSSAIWVRSALRPDHISFPCALVVVRPITVLHGVSIPVRPGGRCGPLPCFLRASDSLGMLVRKFRPLMIFHQGRNPNEPNDPGRTQRPPRRSRVNLTTPDEPSDSQREPE